MDKEIENIPNLVKQGASKIKNKNIQRALDSEIAKLHGGRGSKQGKK